MDELLKLPHEKRTEEEIKADIAELEKDAAAAEERGTGSSLLFETMADLVRMGRLKSTGTRRNGQMVWALTETLQ
jgi:hypothetical protein